MKHLCFFIIICVFSFQSGDLSDRLCGDNEEIIVSFKTKNQKVVSVCKEKKGKYLVYRFGTKAKIDLQYPKIPDETSWSLFRYNGQWRFGGKDNAGFGDLFLEFKNKDTRYRIFEQWSDEEESREFGLKIETVKSKEKKLVVDTSSMIGTLMRLNDLPQIKNEGYDQ